MFPRKHHVITFSIVSFHPSFHPPLLPALNPLVSLLHPSCSMSLRTCVFATLCWSSPCQCGLCRRCWLTLGRTAKGWVLSLLLTYTPLLSVSVAHKHARHLHIQTHTHNAHSCAQINLESISGTKCLWGFLSFFFTEWVSIRCLVLSYEILLFMFLGLKWV